MNQPAIYLPYEVGGHNKDVVAAQKKLDKAKSYKDCSTVILCPTRGGRSLCPRFVQAISGLMRPMNQQIVGPIYLTGMEVGEAYNSGIQLVLDNPQLSKYKYVLTVEDDNLPPPDGLLKLIESIGEYDAVGGLYWTKGEDGRPMIYGDAEVKPLNFIPQQIDMDSVQECNGLGMGFTLFKTDVFRKLPKPWFKTEQSYDPYTGACKGYTQDLYAFEHMRKLGMRVASDNRVKVGHLDIESNILW
jgi:hypothetical protein